MGGGEEDLEVTRPLGTSLGGRRGLEISCVSFGTLALATKPGEGLGGREGRRLTARRALIRREGEACSLAK